MNYMREAIRDFFSPFRRLKERSLLYQIRKLIERTDIMLQNLDALKTSLNNSTKAIADLTAAQASATSTAVQVAVNAALADSQSAVDALVTSAQALESALTSAVAAAKG